MNFENRLDQNRYGHAFLLAIVCYISFFLFNDEFFVNIMEARNFVTAREMIEKGNWLVPTMNGELRLAKPPFPTWITAIFGSLFGMENLAMLRFPAGIMGTLMVFFMYRFSLKLSGNKLKALNNSIVLITSFYVLYMSRTGTWDIYCHSFMLGAIWLLHSAFNNHNSKGLWIKFSFAGVLLGLSFLSKGPVAFFALLLPFLIAYFTIYKPKKLRQNVKPVVLCLIIFAIISFWWPVYISIAHAQEAAAVAKLESGSWINRHVRPFYYYWNFPIQSGIWTVAIFSSLLVPYALKNFKAKKEYKFALIWTLSSVILLSFIPEKKDRYLLPVLIPSAMLAGQLFHHFYLVFKNHTHKKMDRILFGMNIWILILAAFAAPAGVFIIFLKAKLISLPAFVLFTILSELICISLIICWHNKNVRAMLLNAVGLMLVVIIFIIPSTDDLLNQNPNFKSIAALRNQPEINKYNYYRIGKHDFRIELVYEIGKEVKEWKIQSQNSLPETQPFVVLSSEHPNDLFTSQQKAKFKLEVLDYFDNNKQRPGKRRNKEHFKKYVSLITPISAVGKTEIVEGNSENIYENETGK
ncbi:ArnT family glycosyltransferase [Marinifilum caeruleilacunae]|uniref:Phospholipid carrier-dependent glycosyltransferase n=1 Tax=Marinifilum caeruleilacunae TaxID=2499076 RepID=A0ABX1WVF6_9BACT|nr:glycosyltransferase family 39 protein [Marinifilum caeruleilacunae]NOU59884.1 phospholipid carrier-dependent glycosyltransferase [Marinifilum caeruleilacunae]